MSKHPKIKKVENVINRPDKYNSLMARGQARRGVVLIPGLERSLEEGNGNLLQYSCLENSMNRRAWRASVHGLAKRWTWQAYTRMHVGGADLLGSGRPQGQSIPK